MSFMRANKTTMTSPFFGGEKPPKIEVARSLGDPDVSKQPTVARLVARGSWPGKSLYPPSQSMLDAANTQLRRIWTERRAEAARIAAEAEAAAAAAAAAAGQAAAAAAKAAEQAAAEAKAKERAALKDELKAEIKAEQEKEAKAKADAEAAKKAKEEELQKVAKDAADAAVAALKADMNSKKVDAGMSTRCTYCYHTCGHHPQCHKELWDGQPGNENGDGSKSTEKAKEPESNTVAAAAATVDADMPSGPNLAPAPPAAPAMPSSPAPVAPFFAVKMSVEEWDNYNRFMQQQQTLKQHDPSPPPSPEPIFLHSDSKAPYEPYRPPDPFSRQPHAPHNPPYQPPVHEEDRMSDSTQQSFVGASRDADRHLEYEHRFASSTPATRVYYVDRDERGRAYDEHGNEILLIPRSRRTPHDASRRAAAARRSDDKQSGGDGDKKESKKSKSEKKQKGKKGK